MCWIRLCWLLSRVNRAEWLAVFLGKGRLQSRGEARRPNTRGDFLILLLWVLIISQLLGLLCWEASLTAVMNMAPGGTEENYRPISVGDELKGLLFITVLCAC